MLKEWGWERDGLVHMHNKRTKRRNQYCKGCTRSEGMWRWGGKHRRSVERREGGPKNPISPMEESCSTESCWWDDEDRDGRGAFSCANGEDRGHVLLIRSIKLAASCFEPKITIKAEKDDLGSARRYSIVYLPRISVA